MQLPKVVLQVEILDKLGNPVVVAVAWDLEELHMAVEVVAASLALEEEEQPLVHKILDHHRPVVDGNIPVADGLQNSLGVLDFAKALQVQEGW